MGASQLKAVVHLNHVTPPRCRGITGRNLHNKHSVLTEGLIQVRGSREKHRRVPPLPITLLYCRFTRVPFSRDQSHPVLFQCSGELISLSSKPRSDSLWGTKDTSCIIHTIATLILCRTQTQYETLCHAKWKSKSHPE